MGDRNIYLCPCSSGSCSFKTDSLHHLRGHIEVHQNCCLFWCRRCDTIFMDGKEFLQHAQQNTITVYTCSKCAARFLQKAAIQQHWRTKHQGSLCYSVVKMLLCYDRKKNAYYDNIATVSKANGAYIAENYSYGNAESVTPLLVPDIAGPVLQISSVFSESSTVESVSGDHVSHVQESPEAENILPSVSVISTPFTHCESTGHISEDSKKAVAFLTLPEKSVEDVVNEASLETPAEVGEDTLPAHQNIENPKGSDLPVSPTCLSIVEGGILESMDTECSQNPENAMEDSVLDEAENPVPLCIDIQDDANDLPTTLAETTVDQSCSSDASAVFHDHISETAETATLSPESCDNSVFQDTSLSLEPTDGVSQITAVSSKPVKEREDIMIKLTELFGSSELHSAFLGYLYSENGDMFCCSICDKKISGRHRIHEHLFVHFHVPFFSCFFCPYQSSALRPVKIHISQEHPDQKATVKNLCVYKKHLYQTFKAAQPLTIQKFSTICKQLKDNKYKLSQSESCTLTVEKDREFLARSKAETVFVDKHKVSAQNNDTKKDNSAALKNPFHGLSTGAGNCGVKSFKRSMLTSRRESYAPATKSHSNEKIMHKSEDADSEVKHKVPARPRIGTYSVVKTGAISKLKCNYCGKMHLSLGAMSQHLEACSYYLNTQSVSEHTRHARSLVEQMKTKALHSSHSASSKINGEHLQLSDSFEKASQILPSKNVKSDRNALCSFLKSKNVELRPSFDSNGNGCAKDLDDISFGADYTQTVSKRSESDLQENQTLERSRTDKDEQSDENSEETDNIQLWNRRKRKNRDRRLSSSSDEDDDRNEVIAKRVSDEDDNRNEVTAKRVFSDEDDDTVEITVEKKVDNTDISAADSEQIFQCKYCSFTAPSSHKDELQNHLLNRHHRLQDLTKCGYCGSLYGNSTILKRHIKSVHPGKPAMQEHVHYYEFFTIKEEQNQSSKLQFEQQNNKATPKAQVDQHDDKVCSEIHFPHKENDGFTGVFASTEASESGNVKAEVDDAFNKASSSIYCETGSGKLCASETGKDTASPSAVNTCTCSHEVKREDTADLQTSMKVDQASVSRSSSKDNVRQDPPSSSDNKNSSSGGNSTTIHRFECVLCSEKLESQCKTYSHLCKHLNYRPARCGLCQEQFETITELTTHHSKAHPGKRMSQRCVYSSEKEKKLNKLLTESRIVKDTASTPAPSAHTVAACQDSQDAAVHTSLTVKQGIQCRSCQVLLDSISQLRSHCMNDHGIPNDSSKMLWVDSDSKIVYDLEGNIIQHPKDCQFSVFKFLCAFCARRFSTRSDASEHTKSQHADLNCYWVVKLNTMDSLPKSVKTVSSCSQQASLTSTSTQQTATSTQQPATSTQQPATSTQQRNVKTPVSASVSDIPGTASVSCGHGDVVGKLEGEDSGQGCSQEVSGHVASGAELRVMLKDFLSPHFVHEFKTLLLSNGITSFYIGDNLSAEREAYLIEHFKP